MISCLALVASGLLCLPPRSTTPPTPAATYVGRENQLQVRIPRLEGEGATADIDGSLNEPVVVAGRRPDRLLAILSGRRHSRRRLRRRCSIWYSPTAIYVGIRAFEAHGAVHATLADRDKIASDDNVQILLGTFNDRRQAYLFAVNPLGVQMDGTIVESGARTSGGFAPTSRAAPRRSRIRTSSFSRRAVSPSTATRSRSGFRLRVSSTSLLTCRRGTSTSSARCSTPGYEDSWVPAKRSGVIVPRSIGGARRGCRVAIAASCST